MAQLGKPSIVDGLWERVIVTHIEDPSRFTVKLCSSEESFLALMNGMQQVESCPRCTNPIPGSSAVAKFSFDSQWYRVLIKAVRPDGMIEVLYVDYGNSECLPATDVVPIKPEYCKLPMQSVSCCLSRIDYNCKFEPSHIESFRELLLNETFNAKFIFFSPLEDVWHVEMFHSRGSINDWFGTKANSLTHKENIVVPKTFPSPQNAGLLILETVNSNGFQSPRNATSPSRSQSVPMRSARDMSRQTQRRGFSRTFQGVVAYCNSPAEFWLHANSELESLEALVTELNALCCSGKKAPVTQPAVGQLCAALYSEDKVWYRGKIESLVDGKVQVYFIDYGNTELVSVDSITTLNKDMHSIPGYAHCCALAAVLPVGASWSPESCSRFSDLVLDGVVDVGVQDEMPDKLSVNLLVKKQSVASILVSENLAVSAKGSSTLTLSRMAAVSGQTIPIVRSIPRLAFHPGQTVDAVCVYLTSPTEFYCQPLLGAESLQSLMELISDSYADQKVAPLKAVAPGMPCCALYSADGSWYRAEVAERMKAALKVYFVDYGNSEVIDETMVCELLAECHSLPSQAIRCSLYQCRPSQGSQWSPEAISVFDELILSNPASSLSLTIVSKDQDGYTVKVTVSGRDVLTSLTQAGIASVEEQINVTKLALSARPAAATSHATETFSPLVSQQGFPKLPIESDQRFYAFISWLLNPSSFWLQSADSENLLAEIGDISIECAASSRCLTSPSVGDTCIAKYDADGLWYRGEIISLNAKMTEAQVLFVDYGNTELTSLLQVYQVSARLASLPVQATKCALVGIKPAEGETWRAEANEIMQDAMSEGGYCVFIAKHKDTYLVDLTYGNQQSMADALVSAGVAKPTRSTSSQASDRSTGSTKSSSRRHSSSRILTESLPGTAALARTAYAMRSVDASGDAPVTSEAVRVADCSMGELGVAVGSTFTALTVHTQSFSEFYVLLAANKKTMDDMYNRMSTFYHAGKGQVPDKPVVGGFYVAQFSADNDWYRCQVTARNSNGFEVKYIDYGNTEIVAKEQMRHLTPEFCAMAAQALRCSLQGAPELSPPAELASFQKLVTFSELQAKVCGVTDGTVIVDFMASGQSLSAMFCKKQCATYLPTEMKTGTFKGYLVAETESYFFIQRSEDMEMLERIMTEVSSLASTSSTLVAPTVGQPCLALYNDDVWYRAIVTSIHSQHCSVRFVDYGNNADVSLEILLEVAPALLRYPPLAWCCRLPPGLLPGKLTELAEYDELVVNIQSVDNGVAVASLVDQHGQDMISCIAVSLQQHVVTGQTPYSRQYVIPRLKPGRYQVFLSFATTLDKMFMQLASSVQLLEDMRTKTVKAAESASLLANVTGGMACLAQFSHDKAWHRARILSTEQPTVRVLFVDYGNEEITGPQCLREITPELFAHEALAIPCKLLNGQYTEEEAVAFDAWAQSRAEISIEVLEYKDGTHLVEVFDANQQSALTHLNMLRVVESQSTSSVSSPQRSSTKTGSAASTPNRSAVAVPPSSSTRRSKPDVSFSRVVVSKGEFAAYVSHCESQDNIFLQLSLNSDILETLLSDLQKLAKGCEPEVYPPAGQACIARYSDDMWYRAQVVHSELDSGHTKVLFVDYGNSETIANRWLKALPQSLRSLAPLALPCKCADPTLVGLSGTEIKEQLGSEEVVVQILSDDSPPFRISFLSGNETKEDVSADVSAKSSSESTEQVDPLTLRYPMAPIEVGAKHCPVVVSHIVSPYHFYCQFGAESHLQRLANMLYEAYEEGDAWQRLPIDHCVPYQPCVCTFSEDDLWYRGSILSLPQDDACEVLFVDFGNSERVSVDKLRVLTAAVASFPRQAYRCSLLEVFPISKNQEWDDEAISRFRELMEMANSVDADIVKVEETDTQERMVLLTVYTENISVATQLVDAGFCRSTPCPEMSNEDFCDGLLRRVKGSLELRCSGCLSEITERMSTVVRGLEQELPAQLQNLIEGEDVSHDRDVLSRAIEVSLARVLGQGTPDFAALQVKSKSRLQIEVNELFSTLLQKLQNLNNELVEEALGQPEEPLPEDVGIIMPTRARRVVADSRKRVSSCHGDPMLAQMQQAAAQYLERVDPTDGVSANHMVGEGSSHSADRLYPLSMVRVNTDVEESIHDENEADEEVITIEVSPDVIHDQLPGSPISTGSQTAELLKQDGESAATLGNLDMSVTTEPNATSPNLNPQLEDEEIAQNSEPEVEHSDARSDTCEMLQSKLSEQNVEHCDARGDSCETLQPELSEQVVEHHAAHGGTSKMLQSELSEQQVEHCDAHGGTCETLQSELSEHEVEHCDTCGDTCEILQSELSEQEVEHHAAHGGACETLQSELSEQNMEHCDARGGTCETLQSELSEQEVGHCDAHGNTCETLQPELSEQEVEHHAAHGGTCETLQSELSEQNMEHCDARSGTFETLQSELSEQEVEHCDARGDTCETFRSEHSEREVERCDAHGDTCETYQSELTGEVQASDPDNVTEDMCHTARVQLSGMVSTNALKTVGADVDSLVHHEQTYEIKKETKGPDMDSLNRLDPTDQDEKKDTTLGSSNHTN